MVTRAIKKKMKQDKAKSNIRIESSMLQMVFTEGISDEYHMSREPKEGRGWAISLYQGRAIQTDGTVFKKHLGKEHADMFEVKQGG